MKNQITIWNPNTGNSNVSLNELREMLCSRRLVALTPILRSMKALANINVHTTDSKSLQPAAHYTSFAIRRMGAQKAIELFNAGGCQVAKLIN